MCRGSDSDSVNGDCWEGMEQENLPPRHLNQNFFANYGAAAPSCACMGGTRRVRKRHPATVQTPGRKLEENDLMEPLVNFIDRFEVSGGGVWGGEGGGRGEEVGRHPTHPSTPPHFSSPGRDFNDNFRCDDKFFETQFVMEFSHLKMNSQRHGTYDESATPENLKKGRLLSSKLK